MAHYQLPPLKDEKQFEEFICDLFNQIENTESYQNTEYQQFGVKGQKQKGIDIFSPNSKTAIQCKLKDISKRDEAIRKNLLDDIQNDVDAAGDIQFKVEKLIFVSTFRDDSVLQEFVHRLTDDQNLSFTLYYWGWDTLSKYAEQYELILKKYFPKLIPKPSRAAKKPVVELPEGAMGRDLAKKNYIAYLNKRYGDWKQIQFDQEGNGEKFNWASHNKSLMNRYHAAGINYIPVNKFDELVSYLTGKIDKTIFGRNQKAKGRRNYSSIKEHTDGVLE